MEKAGKDKEELDAQFAELKEPELDGAGQYVATLFMDLSRTRQQGMNGPLPITYSELVAYSQLAGQFEPWEIDLIGTTDSAYMNAVAELMKKD